VNRGGGSGAECFVEAVAAVCPRFGRAVCPGGGEMRDKGLSASDALAGSSGEEARERFSEAPWVETVRPRRFVRGFALRAVAAG